MEVKSKFISLVHIKLLYTSTKVTLYALVHIKLLYTSTKDTLYALVHIKLLYTSTNLLYLFRSIKLHILLLYKKPRIETKFLQIFLLYRGKSQLFG